MDETTPKKREITDIYRTTFDHAPVGIAHVAPDGRLLIVNDRFCDIVGHQRTDLLAR